MCEALEKLKRESFAGGEEKGEIKGKAQMAVGMANIGISVEQIAKMANCDTKTVKNWIDKSKTNDC